MYSFAPIDLILLLSLGSAFAQLHAQVYYKWNYVNYSWPTREAYNQALQDGSYVKEHIGINGIKVWRDRIYLVNSRLKNGVPATLSSVGFNDSKNFSPLLSPYPNWRMQNERDCAAFQSVSSMEIDPKGRMWLIDNGRVATMTRRPTNICRPKLMIINLENNEVIYDFAFPQEVVNPKSAILNDIVLDHEDGGFAYITDSDGNDPGIVVFSLRDRSAWKVRHWSMFSSERALNLVVNGTRYTRDTPVNGIALSPASADKRYVFYCPFSSFKLYAVPTWVLKYDIKDIDPYVVTVGQKSSQSDRMIVSASGDLYFGLIGLDAVAKWNIDNSPFNETQKIIIQDHELSQYPDTFDIDSLMRLWYVSEAGIQDLRKNSLNPMRTNFRLIVAPISAKDYQYRRDASTPQLPIIRRPSVMDNMRRLVVDWVTAV